MPSKHRWALNPRKWFGNISNAARKREKNNQISTTVIPLPPTPVTRITRPIPPTLTVPRILTSKNKTKINPIHSNNGNNFTNSTNAIRSYTQFQLPTFTAGREKTTIVLQPPTTVFHRNNTLMPSRMQPSIRGNIQFKEELSVNARRRNTEVINYDTSKLLLPAQYTIILPQNSIEKQLKINIPRASDPDLLNRPRSSSNDCIGKSPISRRSHSSSPSSLSIDDNDVRDESSSSGVFTDERADVNDHRDRKASKDTLSTFEGLSVESIADSQTSLNQGPSRPLTCRYRLPLSTFETNETRPVRLQSEASIARSCRAHSAENLLKDNLVATPVVTRNRQSSAAIVKKIERRNPSGRPSSSNFEKAGFVRVANATYRLTTEKDDHLYRRQRQNSIVPCLYHEDSLPPADDEESYATLPRTSSTEQLNNNLQNDLRAIVDDHLRPMAAAMNKSSRTTKTHHRSKRAQTNSEPMQIDIEDITDKLLSSVDCSTYAQYQRCY